MEWMLMFSILGFAWILLIAMDMSYGGKNEKPKGIGKVLFGSFIVPLLLYELLLIVSVVLIQYWALSFLGPIQLSMISYTFFGYLFGAVGLYFGVSARHNRSATYSSAVRKLLERSPSPRDSIVKFLGIYDANPDDESNKETYQSLLALSKENTELGKIVYRTLFEMGRLDGNSSTLI